MEFRIRTAAVYGGVKKDRQIWALERAKVIVGTPGRIIDFVKDGVLNLREVSTLVLDEADRMLDMGFEPQIRNIID